MKTIRLLIGGSPCTHWSIAQSKNRETDASGIGWELFRNYLIAKEKFNPHYFLYENNKSAAKPIKDQIAKELKVWDGTMLMPYNDNRFTYINSALVSAQNRERFYVTGGMCDISQPEDRGILLRDVLDSGYVYSEKAYTLRASMAHSGQRDFRKHIETNRQLGTQGVLEPIRIGTIEGGTHFPASGVAEQVSGELTIDGKKIYEVRNGLITIKGEQYPIKLPDGFYIIRKLTVAECRRLQTIPDWYVFPVSNSQAYKMLGNGWTVEVIKHILRHIPEIRNGEDCEFEVLSMYDGMTCGAIALTELGVKIKRYVAYEIDKFAIQTACANFPFIEQRGDAFKIRDNDWTYGTDIPAGTMTDAAVWKY